ncbi:MAG TPA: HAMP domain-containing sensor histidine kinase [Candidatus Microsaccharimonas sp.]|nr:HAMP domain-containing sensor histidine kinase [Candidatus Microsaccharimonas sp.]
MFKNATVRLTTWYLAIVMIISLGFSVAVYHFATNELTYGLNSQTQRIFREFPVFTNNPYLRIRDNDVSLGAHHILLRLAYFNLLVLCGAGVLSYWLARMTLEPIETAHTRQKRFTADVSHELRTPLTSLKMNSEVALMNNTASKPELQEALRSNIEDAGRMEQLINNLLRLTQLENDDTTDFADVSSETLVQKAIAQVSKTAEVKQIKLINEAKSGKLHGDPDSLIQLLVILLDNAIKYSPAKSTVTLSSTKNETSYSLHVADEGQGIAPEALPHVFERFYRQDSARTVGDSQDGYGLGLSIAKMIADHNRASITLTSTPQKGTVAEVILPLAQKA